MSNFMLNFKFRARTILGMIPGARRIEAQESALAKEYEEFLNYERSKEPERYLELKDIVTSRDFKERKREIRNQKFKDTEAWKKLNQYNKMKNSREFKGYFNIVSAPEYEDFKKLEDSQELKDFQELEDYLRSEQFKKIKKSGFKDSDTYKGYLKYKKLRKSRELSDYFKVKRSRLYNNYIKLKESKKLTHYNELVTLVRSSEFQASKHQKSSAEFKKTKEHEKLKEYQKLKSDPEIKAYNKLLRKKEFINYKLLDNSPELEEFIYLEKFVNSSDFSDAKKEFEIYKASELHKLKDYRTLKDSVKFRSYFKIANSRDLKYYKELHNSGQLQKYKELEEYLNSDEYRKIKEYMDLPDKFKKSPEYQQLKEYRRLKKSPELNEYFKTLKSGKFNSLKKWELVFADDFNKKLDKDKWLTTFYWGKQLLKQSYSLASDRHFYTDGKNLSVKESKLRLDTRRESITGQAWDPSIGFIPKKFEYTSGLLNTAESFRQKYGAFEAKIRLHPSPSVFHTFSLVSDKIVPHVDIFKFSGKTRNRLTFNTFTEDPERKNEILKTSGSVTGPDFTKEFFIFRLEWSPGKMIWKVNGITVRVEKEVVIPQPMYVMICSGVLDNATSNGLPASLAVDWIKCYKEQNINLGGQNQQNGPGQNQASQDDTSGGQEKALKS